MLVHYLLFKEHYFMDSTEDRVKKRVLNQRYQLTQKHMSAISAQTAQLLSGCLEFDKNKRLRAETLADHPSFNCVRAQVASMMREIENHNQLTESQLRKSTAKGQYFSLLMSFNFIQEVAIYLGKKNSSNLATLYLLKYCLAELSRVRKEAEQRQNVINHPEWNEFVQSTEFGNSFKVADNILANVQKAFEFYYTRVMGMVSQQYPQVAQGIASNLGTSPLAPINPSIPIY
ncbi:MAG: hypothetical protein KDD45_09860 [Bdellovibrionales bacterium]|nr:hypothetical protein [Bdellovibrionales bacterium]